MTLLVGILCDQGAVIAADRQASHGAMGQLTVAHQTTKIKLIEKDTLFASSGPVGLGQQLANIVETEHPQLKNRKYHSFAPLMQKKIRDLLDPAFHTAGLAARVIGPAAQSDVMCGSLLATEFKDGIRLIEISPQGGLEALSAELPFICLGSGKANADPFLGFIWSVYFSGKRPNINEAILAAYWTVKVAIDLKSSGVGFEPNVSVLELGADHKLLGRELVAADLAETMDFIKEAEDALRSIRDRMSGAGDGPMTAPPTLGKPV
jgi:20S proteasome alpha/beta subunit